jgi:hypothetical protein
VHDTLTQITQGTIKDIIKYLLCRKRLAELGV